MVLDMQVAERPSAARRSKQVLEAAETCFRRHGFHATSMAQIAAEAQMSVGHIYRYFPGKDDIIAAILERDVAASLACFDRPECCMDGGGADFRSLLRQTAERKSRPHCSALGLEIMAEAARNPRAAEVVRSMRRSVAQRLCTLLQAGYPGRLSDDEAAETVDMLLRLVESIAFRVTSSRECDAEAEVELVMRYAEKLLDSIGAVEPASAITGGEDGAWA